MQIGLQDRLLLGTLVLVLLAQAYDCAKRRDIIAIAFGFRINVANVVGNSLLFFFQMLDPLDDCPQLILCEARGRAFLGLVLDGSGGGYGGHEGPLALTQRTRRARDCETAAACAISCPASHPQ